MFNGSPLLLFVMIKSANTNRFPWLIVKFINKSTAATAAKNEFKCSIALKVNPNSKNTHFFVPTSSINASTSSSSSFLETTGHLHLRVSAPPVEGQANERIVCFLEEIFFVFTSSSSSGNVAAQSRSRDLQCRDFAIVHGLTSSKKKVEFSAHMLTDDGLITMTPEEQLRLVVDTIVDIIKHEFKWREILSFCCTEWIFES